MYVVLGASGNTGKVVTTKLLAQGQKVRVVGRNAARLQPLTSKGAEAFPGDVTNPEALARAFEGAVAAYVMIRPETSSRDYRAFQERTSDAIATGLKKAGVKHVVSLSSIGADKDSGTGPVVGPHNMEEKLNRIEELNVLHLRPGYFMENTLPQVHAIRAMGAVATPLRPDLKLPMIATRDVGMVASEALLRLDFKGKQAWELLGQRDLDYTEVAAIIGKAIGKPELKYVQAPPEQFKAALLQIGISENFSGLILEMVAALNSGHMRALEPRSARNTTTTTYETFVAEEFVPRYREQAAA